MKFSISKSKIMSKTIITQKNMSNITKKGRLGEGAYGIVYKGEVETKNGKIRTVAVKRNWSDPASIGTSVIREMNFLMSVRHPCIIKCTKISREDPFDESNPLTPRVRRNKLKEDKYLFVMEYVEKDLEHYYLKCNDYYSLQSIMCDIMLGCEFLHAKNIIHRDLKPHNILVSSKGTAKICDFGLSTHSSHYRPSTPGTVTSFYRAPEICCDYDDYDTKIDIWSIGCIFFEIVTKRPFIQLEKDTQRSIFKEIIRTSPERFTPEYLNSYIKKGDIDFFKHNYTIEYDRDKESFKQKVESKIDMNSEEFSLHHFYDLLTSLTYLDPKKRLTATEALAHPFFSEHFTEYILDMNEKYPLNGLEDVQIKIIDCVERRWAVNIAFRVFNKRHDLEWYNHHIIFHSIRLFDEYLAKFYEKKQARSESNTTMGKMHTKSDVNIYFFTILYMVYKHFTALYEVHSWKEIFPKFITSNKANLTKIVNFENFMLQVVCKYVIFRPTMIEYLDLDYEQNYKDKGDTDASIIEQEKELDLKIFLYNYGNIDMSYDGKVKDLYEQIKAARN